MSDPIMDPVDPSEELSPEELGYNPPMGLPPTDEELGMEPERTFEEDDGDEDEEPRSKKKGKKRKPSRTTVNRQKNSREMTFDEWCLHIDEKIGWNAPGVEVRLTRIQPTWWKGISVGGLLDTRSSGKYSEQEVMERFGGGHFQVDVSGPRADGKVGLPPISFKKRLHIAGAPKISDDAHPGDLGSRAPQQVKDDKTENTAVNHLGRLTAQLFEASQKGSHGDEKYFSSTMAAHEDRVRAREQMAQERVNEAETAKRRAEEELEHVRENVRREQREMEEKMRQSAQENNNLMAALLPAFSQNANQQVQQTMATFQAREQRIESDHAKEIQQMQRSHEMSLERADQQRVAELARQDAMYQSQIGILQAQLTTAQSQLDAERLANVQLRDEIRKLHMEQLTAYAKDRDPLEQISKMQAFNEMAKEVIGGAGGSAGPGGLSDEAPDYMKLLAHGVETLGPAIQAVLGAKKEAQQQAQAPQERMVQVQTPDGQVHTITESQARQIQAAQQQQRAQLGPQQKPPEKVKIKAGELKKALEILAAVRPSGTTPEDAAQAAMTHGDHAVLKALSSRPPDQVIEQIDAKGILPAPLADEEGRKYLKEVLQHLRQLASAPGSTREPPE